MEEVVEQPTGLCDEDGAQVTSVLVVDDDDLRRERLVWLLNKSVAGGVSRLVVANAVIPAKQALLKETFDVLLVDLALPLRPQGVVRRDGGLGLIRSLEDDAGLKMPTHIVAITAFLDLSDEVRVEFGRKGFGLVLYEPASLQWEAQIMELLSRFGAALESQEASRLTYGIDVAVVCALPDPEFSSVRALPWGWRTVRLRGDPTIYEEGDINRKNGESWRVVSAAAPRKGMPATTALASKMIAAFRPKHLVMLGICAGNKEKVRLGQVLVADPSWDAGSGKWELLNGVVKFSPSPNQLPIVHRIRESILQLARDKVSLAEIRASWTGDRPPDELRVILGPIASTSSVIADGITMNAIADQHREVIGLDMEIFGLFAAGEVAREPAPIVFAMKAVVDYADPDKADDFQGYASYVCASTFRLLVERHL
jgi:nucleoside phosphorylase